MCLALQRRRLSDCRKTNRSLDQSVPGFPLRECRHGPRVRLSVKLTTGFTDPRRNETGLGHPVLPSHQLCLGAPRSHQRTWVDKNGAKPHQSSDNLSPKQNLGAPYLARFWRDVGFHRSIPEHLPRQVCLSILPDGVFLLREPHGVYQRHGSKQGIRSVVQWRDLRSIPRQLKCCAAQYARCGPAVGLWRAGLRRLRWRGRDRRRDQY
jgi:hypothetical protein